MPNRRVGRNKRAGGKTLKNRGNAGGKFSGKSINVQGGNFLANQLNSAAYFDF